MRALVVIGLILAPACGGEPSDHHDDVDGGVAADANSACAPVGDLVPFSVDWLSFECFPALGETPRVIGSEGSLLEAMGDQAPRPECAGALDVDFTVNRVVLLSLPFDEDIAWVALSPISFDAPSSTVIGLSTRCTGADLPPSLVGIILPAGTEADAVETRVCPYEGECLAP